MGHPICIVCGADCNLGKNRRRRVDSNLATAIRTTVVLVLCWALVLVLRSGHLQLGALSRQTWIFLILSGVATALSWLCYFRALQLGPASKVAPIDKLSVVFVLAIAVLFLREPVTWTQWVGGALIVIGAVVLTF